jgi:hypothetical protein
MLARIFLVLLWWIGLWGLIDILIQKFTRGDFTKGVVAYSSIVLFVLAILSINPELVEYF